MSLSRKSGACTSIPEMSQAEGPKGRRGRGGGRGGWRGRGNWRGSWRGGSGGECCGSTESEDCRSFRHNLRKSGDFAGSRLSDLCSIRRQSNPQPRETTTCANYFGTIFTVQRMEVLLSSSGLVPRILEPLPAFPTVWIVRTIFAVNVSLL